MFKTTRILSTITILITIILSIFVPMKGAQRCIFLTITVFFWLILQILAVVMEKRMRNS